MPLTPRTLVRHELNGLPVRVVESTDPTLVDATGVVVRETQGTLHVETESGVRRAPKAECRFEFALTDDAAARRRTTSGEASATRRSREGAGTASDLAGDGPAGDDAAHVTVDGRELLARPARRTEQEVSSRWQSD